MEGIVSIIDPHRPHADRWNANLATMTSHRVCISSPERLAARHALLSRAGQDPPDDRSLGRPPSWQTFPPANRLAVAIRANNQEPALLRRSSVFVRGNIYGRLADPARRSSAFLLHTDEVERHGR